MVKKDDPDYVFEEYKGHTIASHKNNVAEKDINNLIIVYRKEEFPEYGFIVGLDDSKMSGRRKSFPHNMEDAKSYIDWVVEVRQKKEAANLDKEKPTVMIEGTAFLFDIDKITLTEKGNPANNIYFSSMRDYGTHYEFDYSRVSKKFHVLHSPYLRNKPVVLGNPKTAPEGDPVVTVKIPCIGEIDPDCMCRKYGCTKKDIAEKTDFEIMVDQDIFERRMDGIPVTIDLAGKRFEIDVSGNALRPQDGNGETIYLNALYDYFSIDREAYQLFCNTATSKIEDPFRDGTLNKRMDCVIVEVPRLSDLDPIGANRVNGVEPGYGLMYRTLSMYHDPQILPWEEYSNSMKNQHHWAFQNLNASPAKRDLPTEKIEGTDFIVDVIKFELREKGNEQNVISFKDMTDFGEGYSFEYSRKTKNIPDVYEKSDVLIEIPEFVGLDPVGMAQKYGLTVEEVKAKTDFELMVDQYAFDMRLNKGRLPTIDIAGQLFYVDIRMDMLRPKDDFLSKGILFDEIDHYFSEERNAYLIPYDPKKHEFRELDYDKITEFPKDLIAVQFPFQKELDPIGWNRQGGWDIKDDLKKIGVKGHFNALTVPWQETYLPAIIKENLERQKKQEQKGKPEIKTKENTTRKSRGRKM